MANGLLDPAGGCLGSIETGTPVEVMFADVWLSGDQHGGPYPGPPADDAGEPLQLAERPTASEPRRYDSFCNVAATATGLVTVSQPGDSVIGVRLVVILELVDHRSHASSRVDAMIGIADGVIRLRELMSQRRLVSVSERYSTLRS